MTDFCVVMLQKGVQKGGSARGPRWELRPQTPVIGSRDRAQ